MRKRNRKRHKLRSLIAGITEHHPLVSRSRGVALVGTAVLAVFIAAVNTLRNIGGLFVYACDNRAGSTVEAVFGAVIAYIKNNLARYFREIGIAARCYLAHDINNSCCACCFTRNARVWVLL